MAYVIEPLYPLSNKCFVDYPSFYPPDEYLSYYPPSLLDEYYPPSPSPSPLDEYLCYYARSSLTITSTASSFLPAIPYRKKRKSVLRFPKSQIFAISLSTSPPIPSQVPPNPSQSLLHKLLASQFSLPWYMGVPIAVIAAGLASVLLNSFLPSCFPPFPHDLSKLIAACLSTSPPIPGQVPPNLSQSLLHKLKLLASQIYLLFLNLAPTRPNPNNTPFFAAISNSGAPWPTGAPPIAVIAVGLASVLLIWVLLGWFRHHQSEHSTASLSTLPVPPNPALSLLKLLFLKLAPILPNRPGTLLPKVGPLFSDLRVLLSWLLNIDRFTVRFDCIRPVQHRIRAATPSSAIQLIIDFLQFIGWLQVQTDDDYGQALSPHSAGNNGVERMFEFQDLRDGRELKQKWVKNICGWKLVVEVEVGQRKIEAGSDQVQD